MKQFIEAIGARPNSQGPPEKQKDMLRIGLSDMNTDQHRLVYSTSAFGKRITRGNPEERSAAIKEGFLKTPLWAELHKRLGTTFTEQQFIETVKQITGVNDATIKDLHQLQFAYISDIGCVGRSYPFSKKSGLGKSKRSPKQIQNPIQPQTQTEKPRLVLKRSVPSEQPVPTKEKDDKEISMSEKPRSDDSTTAVSQDLIGLAEYLPPTEKVMIEFGKVKFELRDESSIALAKVLIRVKEKGLHGGNRE